MLTDPNMMTMALLGVAAVLYGLDKSLAPGAGILAVAALAGAIPAKEATGVTLLMAIVGDWCAIWAYRHDILFRTLFKLLPSVAIGIVLGAGFLFVADDDVTRRTIGVILGVFVGAYFVSLYRGRRRARGGGAKRAPSAAPRNDGPGPSGTDASAGDASRPRVPLARLRNVGAGALAGFTTMVANAGGPVTAVYFMSEHLGVREFLGTTAGFYLTVNLVKVPFAIGLNMITWSTFVSMAWTIPLTLLAVVCGRWVARRLDRSVFSVVVYAFSVIAVIQLFL